MLQKITLLSAILFLGCFMKNWAAACEETTIKPYLPISSELSKEAQDTLEFFKSRYQKSQKKMFDGVPDSNDNEGWATLYAENEKKMKEANEEVVRVYGPKIYTFKVATYSVLEIVPKTFEHNYLGNPFLIYVHGGGFTLNSAASQLVGAVPLAHATGFKTWVVDYPVAPKARYANMLNYVYGVLKEVYSRKKIIIYGDSAGANLALAAVLKMRDEGWGLPAALALISPWLDLTGSGETYKMHEPLDPILSADTLHKCARAAVPKGHLSNPNVSPLFSNFEPGMPPTLIQYVPEEMLADDAVCLYENIHKSRKGLPYPDHLSPQPGMWHAFQIFSPKLLESKRALDEMATFFRKHVEGVLPA